MWVRGKKKKNVGYEEEEECRLGGRRRRIWVRGKKKNVD